MCYNNIMFNFPLKYKDKLIQIEDALDIISYAIKFIEANYNCNLEKYQITVEVLSKLIQAIKGISDHKPPKEKIIKAIETIEEIAKKSTNDEKLKTEIEKTAAICKFWIKIS